MASGTPHTVEAQYQVTDTPSKGGHSSGRLVGQLTNTRRICRGAVTGMCVGGREADAVHMVAWSCVVASSCSTAACILDTPRRGSAPLLYTRGSRESWLCCSPRPNPYYPTCVVALLPLKSDTSYVMAYGALGGVGALVSTSSAYRTCSTGALHMFTHHMDRCGPPTHVVCAAAQPAAPRHSVAWSAGAGAHLAAAAAEAATAQHARD